MFTGKLLAIGIAEKRTAPVETLQQVEAVAGKGLAGDRSTEDSDKDPSRQVTFIEQEALQAIKTEYDVEMSHQESRRNLLTEGVPLNHLVGSVFHVGEVQFRGLELCEPCGYLEKLIGKSAKTPLKHRGGLRAEVLTSGTICVGDTIQKRS